MRTALLTLLLLLAPAAPAAGAGSLAAHGMIYLDSPPSFKEAMFAQAADLDPADTKYQWDPDYRGGACVSAPRRHQVAVGVARPRALGRLQPGGHQVCVEH